jgi:MFS family permease
VWWVTLVFATALTGYFSFLAVYLEDAGSGSVGPFFAAYAGTAITLRIVAGWVPDRVGQKRVLYPALVFVAVGFVVLAADSGIPALVAAGVLCGTGHGYAFPILYTFVVSRSRERHLGSASAVFTGLFDLGSFIGAPVLGFVIDVRGYPAMFVGAAAWLAVGIGLFAWWDNRPARAATPVPDRA